MTRIRMLAIAAMAMLVAVGATGVAVAVDSEREPAAPPPTTDTTAPVAGPVPVTIFAAPEPGLLNLQPTAIDQAIVTADPRVLLVTFWSGSPGCYGLQHVEVQEETDEVRVRVITGTRPTVSVCTQEAVRYAAEVTLAEPLGARPVINAPVG